MLLRPFGFGVQLIDPNEARDLFRGAGGGDPEGGRGEAGQDPQAGGAAHQEVTDSFVVVVFDVVVVAVAVVAVFFLLQLSLLLSWLRNVPLSSQVLY